MKIGFGFILLFGIPIIVMISPFLPGDFDPASAALATFIQIYSGLGLITYLPVALWVIMKKVNVNNQRYLRIYFWTVIVAFLLASLMVTFGISKLLGITLLVSLLFFARFLQRILQSGVIPLSLVLLPLVLFVVQLLISEPLTNRSRTTAIKNAAELIDEIDRYNSKYGNYPLTLDAIWKDYKTGILGVEKYHYTNNVETYNLFFEQPRFFFDQFGTREFVVYNPKDQHVILSHASWNMRLEPQQVRLTQGWYASYATGIPHWKYFWFD